MSTLQSQTNSQSSFGLRPPKYSLRGRGQQRQGRQGSNLQSCSQWLKLQEERGVGCREDAKNELSVLTSTFSEGNSFNCIQNAQTVLEFNRANSVNLIKVDLNADLSLASSSVLPPSRPPFHPQLNNSTQSLRQISNPRPESMTPPTPDTEQDVFGTANSGFSGCQKTSQWKKLSKNKFSLRKSQVISYARPQFRVCLTYADIRYALRPLRAEQLNDMCDYRHHMQKRQKESQLSRFLCSHFVKFEREGCDCQPKCTWMNRWLNRAEYEEIRPSNFDIPQKQWENCMSQIEKDLPRTQINCQTFKSETFVNRLRQVLVDYARIDWEIGYVQGMNIVASVLVYHSSNSYEALRIFELLMRQMGLRKAFKGDLSFSFNVSTSLIGELKRLSFDLYSHMANQGLDLKMFATGWYLSLLGNFVPLQWMHGVFQKFMRRGWSGINEILISLLLLLKDELMQCYQQQLIECLSTSSLLQRAQQINWQEVLILSDNLLLPVLIQ